MNYKKIVSTVLITAMTAVPTTIVLAAGANTEVTAPGQAQMKITKEIKDEYSVLIPMTIDIGSANSVTYDIQAKGKIAPQKSIKVTVTPDVTMSERSDPTYAGTAAITLPDGTWASGDLGVDYTAKGGTVTFDETQAGEYEGVATFTVSLEDTTVQP